MWLIRHLREDWPSGQAQIEKCAAGSKLRNILSNTVLSISQTS